MNRTEMPKFGLGSAKRIYHFDGQTIFKDRDEPLYAIGNFIGSGVAGVVYEAMAAHSDEHYALKVLNPLGYRVSAPIVLQRCEVVSQGEYLRSKEQEPTSENIFWLRNRSSNEYIASLAYESAPRKFKELTLAQCFKIWASFVDPRSAAHGNESHPTDDSVSRKFAEFLAARNKIFREIESMRRISGHPNVIRLVDVLEFIQDSKSTLFLVMELANGGELFDRIKVDYGCSETVAQYYFFQLLSGVSHCHKKGVCHRDLKPENLLLSDKEEEDSNEVSFPHASSSSHARPIPTNNAQDGEHEEGDTQDDGLQDAYRLSTLKIADFGFSAMCRDDDLASQASSSRSMSGGRQGSLNRHEGQALSRVMNSVVGSPFYVAPEVLQSQKGYDGMKADSYSCGVILYALLSGSLPFSNEIAHCERWRHFKRWVEEVEKIEPSSQFLFTKSVNNASSSSSTNPNDILAFPSWLFSRKISNQAKALICSLLHPNPEHRLSVGEALNHLWLAPEKALAEEKEREEEEKRRQLEQRSFSSPSRRRQPGYSTTPSSSSSSSSSSSTPPPLSSSFSQGRHYFDFHALFPPVFEADGTDLEGYEDLLGEEEGQHELEDIQEEDEGGESKAEESRGYNQGMREEEEEEEDFDDVFHLEDVEDEEEEEEEEESNQHFPLPSPSGRGTPPSFSNSIKRSTRFVTDMDPLDVLSSIEEKMHEEIEHGGYRDVIGHITHVQSQLSDFTIRIFTEMSEATREEEGMTPAIEVRVFQLPSSQPPYLHLVEFIRAHFVHIFDFKLFYNDIRSYLTSRVRRGGHGGHPSMHEEEDEEEEATTPIRETRQQHPQRGYGSNQHMYNTGFRMLDPLSASPHRLSGIDFS